MRTLVIIPTYNERENVGSIVGRVRASVPDADVLIVDDGSPDGTGELADALAATDGSVHVLHRAGKEGLGAAYRDGMTWALDAGYSTIVEMDADGSHQPEQLPRLLAVLRDGDEAGADVVLGSRWVDGGGVVNWPARRRLISRGGSAYSRMALGLPVKDVTGGYRAFTADALRALHFDRTESQEYCFQIDMTRRAYDAGLRIVEVPITFVERSVARPRWAAGSWWRPCSASRCGARRHPAAVPQAFTGANGGAGGPGVAWRHG
ncbi:polyprenol monophosphomannose synthase [Leifsonia sp. L25]|uniref:polyprenol monophosphomannose synthase n=1 Tax=Leifsonia sp. L25 TaxID=3423957 RepID=UPI003D687D66